MKKAIFAILLAAVATGAMAGPSDKNKPKSCKGLTADFCPPEIETIIIKR